MEAKKLFSKEVIDAQGNSIGKVSDIDIDIINGKVNYIIVAGGLTKHYTVTLDKIATVGDKVILNARKDELEKK